MNKVSIILFILFSFLVNGYSQEGKKALAFSDCITTFFEKDVQKNSTGWAYWFIPSGGIADTLSIKMSYVNMGMGTHDPHSHFADELFLLLEGNARVHLNGEEKIIKPGTSFYAPGNSLHSIKRVDNNPIRYLMFKREIPSGLKVPFLSGKSNYRMKDCVVPIRKSLFLTQDGESILCYLSKEMSNNGLNVFLHILKNTTLNKASCSSNQEVYFILEGKAKMTINGESKVIEALSSCYCPPNSMHNIQKEGSNILRYLVIKTR